MTPQQSNTNAHTDTHTGQPESTWLRMTFLLYDSLVDSVSVFSSLCVYSMKQDRLTACMKTHAEVTAVQPSVIGHHIYVTSEPCSSSCALPRGGNGSRCPGWLCLLISEFCVWEQSTIFRRTENNTVFHGAETQCQEGCFSGNWSMCSSGCLERQQSTGRLGSSESVGELDSRVWHSQYRFSPHRENVCVRACENVLQTQKLLSLTYTGFYLLNPPDF